MKATKDNILHYLHTIKTELQEDGISKIALFEAFLATKRLFIAILILPLVVKTIILNIEVLTPILMKSIKLKCYSKKHSTEIVIL
jgi:hypothetical protein